MSEHTNQSNPEYDYPEEAIGASSRWRKEGWWDFEEGERVESNHITYLVDPVTGKMTPISREKFNERFPTPSAGRAEGDIEDKEPRLDPTLSPIASPPVPSPSHRQGWGSPWLSPRPQVQYWSGNESTETDPNRIPYVATVEPAHDIIKPEEKKSGLRRKFGKVAVAAVFGAGLFLGAFSRGGDHANHHDTTPTGQAPTELTLPASYAGEPEVGYTIIGASQTESEEESNSAEPIETPAPTKTIEEAKATPTPSSTPETPISISNLEEVEVLSTPSSTPTSEVTSPPIEPGGPTATPEDIKIPIVPIAGSTVVSSIDADQELPIEPIQPEATETIETTSPSIEPIQSNDSEATESGSPQIVPVKGSTVVSVEQAESDTSGGVITGATDIEQVIEPVGGAASTIEAAPVFSGVEIYIQPGSSFTQEFQEFARDKYNVTLTDQQAYAMYVDLMKKYKPGDLISNVIVYELPNGDLGISNTGLAEMTPECQEAMYGWIVDHKLIGQR